MILLTPEGMPAESDTVSRILRDYRTIAVVGLSSKRLRPSYSVANYLRLAGYRIIPVNPNETEVLDEPAFARLEDVSVPVDIVEIFRRSQEVPPLVESAISIGAKVVWMQEGIIHRESAERARKAGLVVVMDACVAKEHFRRLQP